MTAPDVAALAAALCDNFDLGHDHDHYTPRICPDGPEDAATIIAALAAQHAVIVVRTPHTGEPCYGQCHVAVQQRITSAPEVTRDSVSADDPVSAQAAPDPDAVGVLSLLAPVLEVVFEEEDDSITVMLPMLPGHVGAAMTLGEAAQEARDAAEAWLAVAYEDHEQAAVKAALVGLREWLLHPDRSYTPHELAMEAVRRIDARLADPT